MYVISVPTDFEVPKQSVIDSVRVDDCIDVLVEGETNARRLADDWAKKTPMPIGITMYDGQTPAKLQSELDVAKTIAGEQGKRTFCYNDWKKRH